MQTATIGYGKGGLPHFGGATIAAPEAAKIEKLNNLFNKFVGEVSGVIGEGNLTALQTAALSEFVGDVKAGYWPLYNCITHNGMVS